MAKIYKTALGKQIDIDHLALTNEHVIAVGNMRVNSRGDELGAGGKIVKTRDQIMKEYYALNTPIAADPVQVAPVAPVQKAAVPPITEIPTDLPADPIVFNAESGLDEIEDIGGERQILHVDIGEADPATVIDAVKEAFANRTASEPADASDTVQSQQTAIRGSLASAVAKTATVTQVEKLPPKKARGVQRF